MGPQARWVYKFEFNLIYLRALNLVAQNQEATITEKVIKTASTLIPLC